MIKVEMKIPSNTKSIKEEVEPIIKELNELCKNYPHIGKDVEILIKN